MNPDPDPKPETETETNSQIRNASDLEHAEMEANDQLVEISLHFDQGSLDDDEPRRRRDYGGYHRSRKKDPSDYTKRQVLAGRIEAAMKAAHYSSVGELSVISGVSPTVIYNARAGRTIMSPAHARRVAMALRLPSSDWLFGLTPEGNYGEDVQDHNFVMSPSWKDVPVLGPPPTNVERIAILNEIRKMHGQLTTYEEARVLADLPIPELPSDMPAELLQVGIRPLIKGEPVICHQRRMAGERLRYMKSFFKCTKVAMAVVAGISDQCFNEAFQGRSILSDEPCHKLAKKYGVTIPYLKGLPIGAIKQE